MRRLLTALIITFGLFGAVSTTAPAQAASADFAAPTAVYDFSDVYADTDSGGCVFTVRWSHAQQDSVKSYYFVLDSATKPAPGGKDAANLYYSSSASSTDVRVQTPLTATSYSAWVMAESSSGKFSDWTQWSFDQLPC